MQILIVEDDVRLAAALGYLAVRGSDKISWYTLRGKTCRRVTEAVSGRENLFTALESLAALRCGG